MIARRLYPIHADIIENRCPVIDRLPELGHCTMLVLLAKHIVQVNLVAVSSRSQVTTRSIFGLLARKAQN